MNQILYEDTGDRKPADIKKIILFFVIAVIVFGIALGAIGIVQLLNSKTPASTNKPVIMVEKFNDDEIKLSISHDKTIEKIVYDWNGADEEEIEGANRKFVERLIEIPAIGENVLNVYVTDSIGIEASFTGSFSANGSSNGPRITFDQIEEGGKKKINIRAVDNTEIAYLTYKWNDGEEVKVDDKDISHTIIEVNIEIPNDLPTGDNELIVVAVDGENNKSEEKQEIKIAKKPIIETPKQNGSKLKIKITDETGLDYVRYILNGESYTWRSKTDDTKVCETTIELQPGENTIIINARNKDGIDAKTFRGRCVYKAN